MTTEAPKVKPAGRYSARETELLLGISKNTLLRATKRGDITAKRYTTNRRKFYTGQEIMRYYNAVI